MRYLRYFALLAVLALPAVYSHAGVSFEVQVGPTYVAQPACPYGYYAYYPYECAPYGYYGPNWFVDGVFIGAGPWYHHYRRPVYRYYDNDDYDRDRYYYRDYDHDRHYYRHDRDDHDQDWDRDWDRDWHRHHHHHHDRDDD